MQTFSSAAIVITLTFLAACASGDAAREFTDKAQSRYYDGDYEEAVLAGNKALGADPAHAQAWYWIGMAQYKSGLYDDAIDSFEKRIISGIRGTQLTDSHVYAGYSHFYLGRMDQAIRRFSDALETNPSDRRALEGKAYCYLGLGDSQTAQRIVEDINAKHPHISSERIEARIHYVLGDRDKAMSLYGGKGWMGTGVADYRLGEIRGARVTGTTPGGPGDLAGLLHGDVVIRLNGAAVSGADELEDKARELPPGVTARLTVLREGYEKEITITPDTGARAFESDPIVVNILKRGKIPAEWAGKAKEGAGAREASVVTVRTGRAVTGFGRYHALVIGNDDYGSLPRLTTAVRDARGVAKTLRGKYGFEVKTLENATRKRILGELYRYRAELTRDDNFLLYYAGHGYVDEATGEGSWLPIGSSMNDRSEWIFNADIKRFFAGLKAKQVLLIADSCFSGSVFRSGRGAGLVRENSLRYYRRAGRLPSRRAITSGGLEPVADGGRNGHSIFAYYLIKKLTESEQRLIDSSRLFDRLKVAVTNNSNQRPLNGVIKDTGDEGGDFIFIRK